MSPSRRSNRSATATSVTPALLRRWKLPVPEGGDKEARGRVLVVGGAPGIPGAIILAATAALRAGCGKLQIATCASIATAIACAVPEALVVALPETRRGGIARSAASTIVEYGNRAGAVLIGPGMMDERAAADLVRAIVPRLREPAIVLDAEALACLRETPLLFERHGGRVALTPHAGEMAGMLGVDIERVKSDPLKASFGAARRFKAIVALKGAQTFVAGPGGDAYCNRNGNVGLATSGSGDTLAGVVAGLAARGVDLLAATVWGVHAHARAGDRLAKRIGRVGFLARELLAEIPVVLTELSG